MSKSFNSIGECRPAVVVYFDSVTSEVDEFFETQLRAETKAWLAKAWAFKYVGWPTKTK